MNSIDQHRNLRQLASLGALSVGLIVASIGCSVQDASNTDSDQEASTVAVANQALSGKRMFIYFSDGRTAQNVVTTLAGNDQSTGTYYSDWEASSGEIPGKPGTNGVPNGAKKISWMVWNLSTTGSDRLKEVYYVNGFAADPYSMVRVDDMSSSSMRFTGMRVTVSATINGYCHEDWQDVDWSNDVILYFNGNNASWDGSCYRGDLLRTTP